MEPAVFIFIRQPVGHRIIVIHNVPNPLRTYVAFSAVQRLVFFRQLPVGIAYFFMGSKGVHKADFPASGMRRDLAGQLPPMGVPDFRPGQMGAFYVELHQPLPRPVADMTRPDCAPGAVIPQNVPLLCRNPVQHPGCSFMGFGGIAVFAHVQIQHHRIIGIGNGRGVSPGVLRIEHQVILRCSIEVRVLAGNLSIQPLTQLITVLRVFVMLHGVRRAANAVGPPVVQVPRYTGASSSLGRMAAYSSWRETIFTWTSGP